LHYGAAFLDDEELDYFSQFEFNQRYAVERACLALADGGFYIEDTERIDWQVLLGIMQQVCRSSPQSSPVAVLRPKSIYPLKLQIPAEGGLYFLELDVEADSGGSTKGVVCNFRFFDAKGNLWESKLPIF